MTEYLLGSENLILKPLTKDDNNVFLNILSDKALISNMRMESFDIPFNITSLEEGTLLISKLLSLKWPYFGYIIYYKNNPIGYIEAYKRPDEDMFKNAVITRYMLIGEYDIHEINHELLKIIENNFFLQFDASCVCIHDSKSFEFHDALMESPFVPLIRTIDGYKGYYVLIKNQLNTLIDIDNSYVAEFSASKNVAGGCIYEDKNVPDKWMHNYMYLKGYHSSDDIKWYEKMRIKNGCDSASFLFSGPYNIIDYTFLEPYEHDDLAYYMADGLIVNNINKQSSKNAKVRIVTEDNMYELIMLMYMEDRPFGDDYAKRNSVRYADVLAKSNKIKYFIIYDGKNPVGYISGLKDGRILKLEDFVISRAYQRKGYGSFLFKEVLKYYDSPSVYVVADKNDTPKEMYEKWGFKYVGEAHFIRKMFKKI